MQLENLPLYWQSWVALAVVMAWIGKVVASDFRKEHKDASL